MQKKNKNIKRNAYLHAFCYGKIQVKRKMTMEKEKEKKK